MWGLLSAIGLAAVSIQHLLDVNNAEMEKQKKDREIRRLQEELEEEQRRKREIEGELDLERLRKNIAESNTIEYIRAVGRVTQMRLELAEIESEMSEDDSDYDERSKRCEHLKGVLDDNERSIDLELGEFKPRNMTKAEMYSYYLKYLKEDDDRRKAERQAAATEEMRDFDKELRENIDILKSNLANMERNLVEDGSEDYLRDLQNIKDTKERIDILERRLSDNKYRK